MFKLGTILTIEKVNDDQFQRYKSKIMDFDEDTISIDYPVELHSNRMLYVMNGEQLKISFVEEESEQAYQFITMVIGKRKETIPLLVLSCPKQEDIVRIQRREFVRINYAIDVAVHPLYNEFAPFNTITNDISAGGASIFVPKNIPISQHQEILCWFVLPRRSGEYHYLKFTCEVVRIIDYNETRKILSLKFLNNSQKQEQILLQFCYEAQVALRKKEIME
ncbi:flagellar brake protein [Caldifermentibacillus hisashii]